MNRKATREEIVFYLGRDEAAKVLRAEWKGGDLITWGVATKRPRVGKLKGAPAAGATDDPSPEA